MRRGVEVAGFSPRLGAVAEELREQGMAVAGRLEDLPFTPDIIHGHHHMEIMKVLLRCPSTPAILICHGSLPWEETPVVFPRILRYLGVDTRICRDLRQTEGIDPERVVFLPNFVDLERFLPRGPLPDRPRRAVLFSSTFERDKLDLVRTACREAGLELDLLGKVGGSFCPHPERELGSYDLVFAKGRGVIESLAVGTAVVVMDFANLGPMVKSANFDRLRSLNFSLKVMDTDLTAENLVREIKRYDARDARAVQQRIRKEVGMERVVDQLMEIYQDVIDEFRDMPIQREDELRAAARYLEWLILPVHQRAERREAEVKQLDKDLKQLKGSLTFRLQKRILSNPLSAKAARSIAHFIRRHSRD